MINSIFVNLPVKDLQRSIKFFTELGFTFNPQFTNEEATCMILGENMYAMLLVQKVFTDFSKRPISDAPKTSEVITSLMINNRADVDLMADRALMSGAQNYSDPVEMGFMYNRSFQDLDGHLWEIGWMDPTHIEPF